MGNAMILFVDDEKDFRFLSIRQMKRNLKNQQYEFLEAEDGEEALALLKGGLKPSLMIIDYAMPRINGVELLRIIDAEYPDLRNIPRIMISGYIRHEEMQRESQALKCTFFEKNLDADFYIQLCRHIESRIK